MASRKERNEAFRTAFGIKAIPFLTEIFNKCKLGYNSIDVKASSDKHDIPTMVVPTMVDLQILTCTGQKKNAKFHWKDGIQVTNDLAIRIYDRMTLNKRVVKANKNLEKSQNDGFKKRNLVPIVGTRRPLDFIKDQTTNLIFRGMSAVYGSLSEQNSILTYSMIFDLIQKEVNNETMTGRIVKALVDGNYIVCNRPMENTLYSMYSWKEQEPNEEHANFIKDMIKEETGNDRANRIFDFLMFLHKLKAFTPMNMRAECHKHKLSSNDQSVITAEVLEYQGNKLARSYRWKSLAAPSMEMAESIAQKSREYGAKYAKPYEKPKTEMKPAVTNKYANVHINVLLDYLKVNDSISTDKAMELITELTPHSVSNIFWRLCKDGVCERTAHKTYAMKGVVKAETKTIETKTEVKSEVKKIEALKKTETDDSFIGKLNTAIEAMQTRRNEIKTELDGVDSKLKEAKELLATKEKEQAFLDSLSIYVPTESYKVSHQNTNTAMVNSQKDRKEHNSKHSHSRTGILDLLSKKETVSLEELTEHFYPGKNFNWNNAEVKALSAMIYQLKKEEKLEGASLGSYKLKKQ